MTRSLAALVTLTAACAAYGAPFADPTRPPGAVDPSALPAAGPRLESVLIAPDRRVAVISGEEVTIGSRFRDGEVVRISEGEVAIRRPGGEELLKLFTGGGRRPAPAKGR
jgi:hypothetical protein